MKIPLELFAILLLNKIMLKLLVSNFMEIELFCNIALVIIVLTLISNWITFFAVEMKVLWKIVLIQVGELVIVIQNFLALPCIVLVADLYHLQFQKLKKLPK